MTWPLVLTIASDSIKVLTRKLSACFQQDDGLTVSWFSFVFFFKRFEGFFFLIESLVLLTTSIHLSDTGKQLEWSFRFSFNSFIKHFVLEI